MMSEQDNATIRVAAPVIDHDIPVCAEVMYARRDPAHPHQAILVNVPVLADGINFGDIVRLGAEDECGVRPIIEVVVASGHVRMLAAAAEGEAHELVAELERRFPAYALRIEGASDTVVSVSVHPDFDPDEVAAVIKAWLAADPDLDDEEPAIAEPSPSELGLIAWA